MNAALPSRLQLRTLPETAEILRCSVKTVQRRIANGTIRAVRDGRKILVELTEIERYVVEHRM